MARPPPTGDFENPIERRTLAKPRPAGTTRSVVRIGIGVGGDERLAAPWHVAVEPVLPAGLRRIVRGDSATAPSCCSRCNSPSRRSASGRSERAVSPSGILCGGL